MYHSTEYLLIAIAVVLMSLGVGLFTETAWMGWATLMLLVTLMTIWIYVRESDL